MELKRNITMVVDCDEVLTNISPLWTELIHRNGEYFSKYFDLMPNFNFNNREHTLKVLMRDEFYLNKCFRKESLCELSKEEEEELFKKFFALYDNEKFYEHVIPTRMGKVLSELCETSYINKLYVISKTTKNTLTGKTKFLDKLFEKSNGRYEFIPVELKESKSSAINRLGKIDVFMDDELNNVRDIMTNCSKEMEMDIYIPKLGYNFPTEDLNQLCNENNKRIIYYNAL